jgi:hypothetical protein
MDAKAAIVQVSPLLLRALTTNDHRKTLLSLPATSMPFGGYPFLLTKSNGLDRLRFHQGAFIYHCALRQGRKCNVGA